MLLFSGGVRAAEDGQALRLADSLETVRVAAKALPDAVQELLRLAVDQDGVSYRRGGVSPESGFDCSGFVRYVFDRVGGVALPHSAAAISKLGSRIALAELQPGDLVFFRIMHHAISHVGIYLGDNRFIHASSLRTGGVVISNLTDGYWQRHFSLARRLDVPSLQAEDAPGLE